MKMDEGCKIQPFKISEKSMMKVRHRNLAHLILETTMDDVVTLQGSCIFSSNEKGETGFSITLRKNEPSYLQLNRADSCVQGFCLE